MSARPQDTITLEFKPSLDDARGQRKELRDGLSAVRQVGNTLWVANDESASVERLQIEGDAARHHTQFHLCEFLDMPKEHKNPARTPEIDIEGLDHADGYLWVAGSHSFKRCKPDEDDSPARQVKALGRVDTDANRFMLARIPMVDDEDSLPALARKHKPRRAQQLPCDARSNALTRLLRKDPHLGPFIGLPGKENGFDIEGLAVADDRIFLGLRGPVLRGWAVVLSLRLEGHRDELCMLPIDGGRKKGGLVCKHFLPLAGLGIRDLCVHGDDLLVLAGPTMSLDGPVRVLRWTGAARGGEASGMVDASALRPVLELPYGDGCDHAEGMALLQREGETQPRLLVVCDRAAKARQVGADGMKADLFAMPRT
jgi:hypothetical protein